MPSSQQQPRGSCKLQFENQPSVLSPHLDGIGLSWQWVVEAVDSEDNRGQGIDRKTWNIVLLEREKERLALEILVCGDRE